MTGTIKSGLPEFPQSQKRQVIGISVYMKNNKEEKILRAAEKVFFSKGFFPARMEDIAEEAGVGKGTLYLYFKDKTSIYVHLMNHRLEEAVTVLESIKNVKMS